MKRHRDKWHQTSITLSHIHSADAVLEHNQKMSSQHLPHDAYATHQWPTWSETSRRISSQQETAKSEQLQQQTHLYGEWHKIDCQLQRWLGTWCDMHFLLTQPVSKPLLPKSLPCRFPMICLASQNREENYS